MNKEFIPYEQALALKELGFDEKCFYAYCEKGGWNPYKKVKEPITYILRTSGNPFGGFDSGRNWNKEYERNKNRIQCSAPLYQQAFRWFREKGWCSVLLPDEETNKWRFTFFPIGKQGTFSGKYDKTYEEAQLECLKQLIKIVKDAGK